MSNAIIESVTKVFNKSLMKVKKHSPEIFLGAGILCGIGSTVSACYATTKVSGILEETKTQVDQIHYVLESDKFDEEQYSVQDSKKDLAIVYVQSAIKIAKLYGPSVILAGLSIGFSLKGHNILRKRNIALAAAYATVDKGFKEYRNRVVDRFGEVVDRELKYGVKAEKITEVETDPETGKEKKVKKTVDVVDDNLGYSPYAICFDESCPGWEKDPTMNLSFLRGAQEYFNDLLKARGYVFLSDIYDYLGVPQTPASRVVGWIFDKTNPEHDAIDNSESDGYIDFGLFNVKREAVRDFLNGYTDCVILDFNVDGYILDRM